MRDRVIEALKRLFEDRGVDIERLGDDEDLAERLAWDSIDLVDLGMEVERRHGVSLPEGLDEINTIARLTARFSEAAAPGQR